MRYLKATKSVEITYNGKEKGGGDLVIKRYFNIDWADNHAIRKLTSGFVFILNRNFVSWYTKKQVIVALFLTKAQYVALTLVAKKAIWLKLLIINLGLLKTSD